MILATIKNIQSILDNNDIEYTLYKPDIELKGNIIFPSVKAFIKNKEVNKVTPIIRDALSNLQRLSYFYKIYYMDAKISHNGTVYFSTLNNNFIKFLGYKFTVKEPSKIHSTLKTILKGYPSVIHTPFLIAFYQGLYDKFEAFAHFIKENRLVTTDNKKFFISLDKLLATVNLQDTSDPEVRYLLRCYNMYKNKKLENYLDDEDNVA